jgi:hypothetical protein
MPSSRMYRQTCDIEQPKTPINEFGAEDDEGATVIYSGMVCSIQTAPPEESELWKVRGVDVAIKVFTEDPFVLKVAQGMVVVDKRFTPFRKYIVIEVTDMGARGEVYSIACKI